MDNQEYAKVSKEIRNYKIARMNVLLILLFTLISAVMLAVADRYFLFSVFTCVLFIAVGQQMRAEAVQSGAETYGNAYLAVAVVIALVILAVYLVFWLLSKKHRWAMIVLLVLFSIDCVLLLTSFSVEMLLDIAFHAWMIYYFILGVKAAANLTKHFPQGVRLTVEQLNEAYRLENGVDPVTGTPVERPAEMSGPSATSVPGGEASFTAAETEGESASAQPVRYDPMTGEPIYGESAQPVRYDPMTGEPIYGEKDEKEENAPADASGEANPEAPELPENPETPEK